MLENLQHHINLARQGDTKSLELLWQEVKYITKKWVNRTHIPSWDREDLEQEAYLILVESIHKWDQEAGMTFYGYYKIRLSVWRQLALKKKTEHPALGEDISHTEEKYDTAQVGLEEAALIHLRYQEAIRLLDGLTPIDRQLILSHYFHGHSLEQSGAELGLKRTGASSRIQRALKKIQAHHQRPSGHPFI